MNRIFKKLQLVGETDKVALIEPGSVRDLQEIETNRTRVYTDAGQFDIKLGYAECAQELGISYE